jgi:endonuclease-8
MAEGPEVRRKAEKLREALVGKPLDEVRFVFERLTPFEPVLTGRRVTAVDTFGKAMVIRIEGGLNLYVHPKMFGHWILRKRPGMPKTDRQLRITLRVPGHVPDMPARAARPRHLALLGGERRSETAGP